MARDPGLQAERTALAWSRTGLGALVNALVLFRAGMVNERLELVALGLLLLVSAALTYAFSRSRRRALVRAAQGARTPALAILGIAATTGACSVGVLVAIVIAVGRA